MDDLTDISEMYNSAWDAESTRLQRHRLEPAISADDESYHALDGKQREMWLNLLFEVSAERSMLAASRHLLYVGRRGDG